MGRDGLVALVLAIVLIAVIAPAVSAYQTKNVIIVVFDGVRQEEMFEDPVHSNIPVLWNLLAPRGTLYTDVYNGNELTTTSPGHATILTGVYQAGFHNNEGAPRNVTIFELFRKQTNVKASKVWLVAGKEKHVRVVKASQDPAYGGLGAKYRTPGGLHTPAASDTNTWRLASDILNRYHPNLMLVNLGYSDSVGHKDKWNAYVGSVRNSDRISGLLWKKIQDDPAYANRTTLILTSDHGRHTTDWSMHGDKCGGCTHVWVLVIGPDTPAGIINGERVDMRRIEPTAAALLGVTNPPGLMDPLPGALFPGWNSLSSGDAGFCPPCLPGLW